jgi:hypothetical protein
MCSICGTLSSYRMVEPEILHENGASMHACETSRSGRGWYNQNLATGHLVLVAEEGVVDIF